MSLTKQIVDELNRGDLSPVEREYGEWIDDDPCNDGPWPSEQELADDEREQR